MIPRQRIPGREPLEEKRPLRRQPDDHHFWSLIMLAVTVGAFPAGRLGGYEGALCLSPRVSNPLKSDWQRHVVACSGYLELGIHVTVRITGTLWQMPLSTPPPAARRR